MKQEELFVLMERFEKSSIHELEYKYDDTKIVLRKESKNNNVVTQNQLPVVNNVIASNENTNNANQVKDTQINGTEVKSPIIGTFYSAPSPQAKPFVQIGQKVEKGQTLCVIEAMKMLNEIPSPCAGTITDILIENEDAIGFDQVLFYIQE